MQIRDTRLAALAVAGFGLWICFLPPALAESNKTTAKKPSDAPIVLSKFSKQKTHHTSAKIKSKSARLSRGAKLADAAMRGKAGDAMKNLAALRSVANARAEFTTGDTRSKADDEARNIAATDDNEIITMNGVQIASADQLNDIDRAIADEKPEARSDDITVAAPTPAAVSGRIVKALPSGERHFFKSDDGGPWNKTSLIGKLFVAFGSLLTLASAARLIIA